MCGVIGREPYLRHDAEDLPHRIELNLPQVLPINRDAPGLRVVEAIEQSQYRALARSRAADDCYRLTGLYNKGDAA